ncbi:hypothetical protein JTE90_020597 [Oedothorax gibbosus]|uniref:glutathione transferase n=1 Tax=Oedothorax gibbosus TaxID=931172 RepID=A0AAV6VXY2_9ARAC|nr:hypothetical protein JTE90_020597 [Oedothorax gibbosus]
MAKPIFGYWDVRGIAEPIRYLLRYKNVDFEDKQYLLSDPDSWFGTKFTYGLDFPNLPYYMDGSVKLTQSTTILRYLAKKYNLEGETEEEKLRVSLLEQQIVDWRTSIIRLVYNENYEKLQPDFVKGVPEQLKRFEAFLGDRKFFAGEHLTYVDLMAFEIIEYYRYMVNKVLDGFPVLREYRERMIELPGLKKYLESPEYRSWPLFAPHAQWGGKGPEPKVD